LGISIGCHLPNALYLGQYLGVSEHGAYSQNITKQQHSGDIRNPNVGSCTIAHIFIFIFIFWLLLVTQWTFWNLMTELQHIKNPTGKTGVQG